MAATNSSNLTDRQAWFARKNLLKPSLPLLVLEKLFQRFDLPNDSTSTMVVRRYPIPDVTDAFLAAAQLSEGITPVSLSMPAPEDYPILLRQYGLVQEVTDIIEQTFQDDIAKIQFEQLGKIVAIMIEKIRWAAAVSGTSSSRILAGNVASESLIATSITKNELRQAVRQLSGNNAERFTEVQKSSLRQETYNIEPAFFMVVNTDAVSAIRELGNGFIHIKDYGDGTPKVPGEFGAFEDIRFIASSILGKRANLGGAVGSTGLLSDNGTAINLYDGIIFGKDAAATVALNGEHSVTPIVVPNVASDSNPLMQRAKVGVKMMQEAKVVQPLHMKKITFGALK